MAVTLGVDSSVLSPFARAKHLDVLERITIGRRCVVTRAVLDEIDRGSELHPLLADVRAQSWLQPVSVDSLNELVAFNHYVRILGAGDRNIGEASLLAWAETSSGIAIIDDHAAVHAARSRKVAVRRSLGLLCDALHRNLVTSGEVCSLIDDLAVLGGARLPCDGAGFEQWAERNGLLAAR